MTLRKFLLLYFPLLFIFIGGLLFGPPTSLELTKSKCLDIMTNLETVESRTELRALFDRDYNFSELLNWEHERLHYTSGLIKRYADPLQIIEYGKGKCQEFTILYVALTLAHGYQSRLVFDIYGDHSWAEIKLEGIWIHVDPSEKRINDPYMYQENWGKELWLVLAFWNGTIEDVTTNYRT